VLISALKILLLTYLLTYYCAVLWCSFNTVNSFFVSFVYTAAFITLRPIIMVELLGIQQLTNAYGLSCLFLGVAYVVGSPISG